VLSVVERLPATFRLADAYRFTPELHRKHPENRHVADKIRQQLQVLRDDGEIRFGAEAGVYHRVATHGPVLIDELPWHAGQETTREEIAALIERDPNFLRKGMVRAADGPYRQHLFLFHNAEQNPYGDRITDERIVYVGEGQKGDQLLQGANRYLADHLDLGMRVHLFVKPKASQPTLRYEGEVVCGSARRVWRPEEDRSVIEYDLVRAGPGVLQPYALTYAQMLEDPGKPELVPRRRRLTMIEQVQRDRSFRSIVLTAYRNLCAICGDPITTPAANELHAAHITPAATGGPEYIINGLALCVRHHWAFDAGVFTLTDDYRVILLQEDPHGELEPDLPIHLPEMTEERPHPFFLGIHRSTWPAAA
jgi:hypothetical protein